MNMRAREKVNTETKKAIIIWLVIADVLMAAVPVGMICISVFCEAIWDSPLIAVIYFTIGIILTVGGWKGHNFIIDRLYHKKYISRERYYEG